MKYFQINPKKNKEPSKPLDENDIWKALEDQSENSDQIDVDEEDLNFYDEAEDLEESLENSDNESLDKDSEADPETIDYEMELSGSDEETIEKQEKPTKRRKTESLAKKAKTLGYKGSFFNDATSEFAPMEDFEELFALSS